MRIASFSDFGWFCCTAKLAFFAKPKFFVKAPVTPPCSPFTPEFDAQSLALATKEKAPARGLHLVNLSKVNGSSRHQFAQFQYYRACQAIQGGARPGEYVSAHLTTAAMLHRPGNRQRSAGQTRGVWGSTEMTSRPLTVSTVCYRCRLPLLPAPCSPGDGSRLHRSLIKSPTQVRSSLLSRFRCSVISRLTSDGRSEAF